MTAETEARIETCPTCKAALRKIYAFGNPHVPVSEVYTYTCSHAVALRHDPAGVLNSRLDVCGSYSDASGIARFHKLDMQSRGLA